MRRDEPARDLDRFRERALRSRGAGEPSRPSFGGPAWRSWRPSCWAPATAARTHRLAFETRSGRLLRNLVLGPDACFVLCVANPVATSRDGRWVVFAREWVTYFVDTARDLPAHRITGFGSGVAASPREDAFYFLNGYGVVTKVAAP